MTSTGPRPGSVSSSSLMQDVPGAFPVRTSIDQDDQETTAFLSLTEAVHARRAEYVRPKHVRIKIGTWNVAALKGTEKDVGAWFVEGRGISKALSGLHVDDGDEARPQSQANPSGLDKVEDVETQEARYARKQPTVPTNDPGTVPGNENIGIYVLALQEIVDISSPTEALRPYTDPSVAKKWKDQLEETLPKNYLLVAEQQLIGLLLLIYASPDIANEVRSVSTTSVGTGLMGYMGNKGAVTGRIVIGDTTRLVFINSHLAAGADQTALERRNWDASQIVQRTRFDPIQDAMDLAQTTGEQIGDEDFAFWVGDLNYRLGTIPGDDVRRLLMLHTRHEYDSNQTTGQKIDKEIEIAGKSARVRVHAASVSSTDSNSMASPRPSVEENDADTESTAPSTLMDDIDATEDPTSLQTTLSSLLPHDELHQQIKRRKAFQDGWREGPISFLPTYKYDVGSVGIFDSSEKKRAPSWCDRILYRTRKDKLAYDAKVKEEESAKKKDAEMRANGTDSAGDDDEILYDYDPDADGVNDDYEDYDEHTDAEHALHKVITKEGVEDELQLEYYTAHQRVLSSDHKPLNAVFSLKYEAVVPHLKAKVHAEVAKDLDKAENEGRPNVTIVVDQQQGEQCEECCKDFEGVSFGDVRWNQQKTRSLTVANTSRVAAGVTFVERPVDSDQAPGIAPSWLSLKLNDIVLSNSSTATKPISVEPGDTVSVELGICVSDINLVRALNDGVQSLEDILVLRVEGGRDHFIPVKAKWLESSLGRSINKLIRIPEGGIRKLQNQRPDPSKSREKGGNNSKPDSGRDSPAGEEAVRFSAPRELFRLTEAIEELGTRVVAEYDMISSDDAENAPWRQHPGWPFDQDCWTERDTIAWKEAMGDVCNALDTDQPLEASMPEDMSSMQRFYVLSSLLVYFIKGIPEGMINDELWTQIDTYLADLEKIKDKPTIEERRTAIQEILSHSPSHSISFVLLTTMLDRLLQEIGGTSSAKSEAPTSPASKLAVGALRRVTGTFGKGSTSVSHRDQASAALSRVFAGAIFRAPAAGSKKLSSAQERRRADLVEMFLKKDEPP